MTKASLSSGKFTRIYASKIVIVYSMRMLSRCPKPPKVSSIIKEIVKVERLVLDATGATTLVGFSPVSRAITTTCCILNFSTSPEPTITWGTSRQLAMALIRYPLSFTMLNLMTNRLKIQSATHYTFHANWLFKKIHRYHDNARYKEPECIGVLFSWEQFLFL